MNLAAVKYVYLLGAGGIGMSALGRYFMQRGIKVSGYDKTATPLTRELVAEGMHLIFEDREELLPLELQNAIENEELLVIYTPAIPADSKLFQFFKTHGIHLHKRAEVVGIISKSHPTIAVAGTHGKTTTSSLIAHVLENAGKKPVAFLGGIASNYGTNYLPGTSESILVVEADEYDRSFLHLHPDTAIITSTDADHLDIYGKKEALEESFWQFAAQTAENGHIIIKAGLNFPKQLKPRVLTYHTSEQADIQLLKCELVDTAYQFSVRIQGKVIEHLSLGLPGFHNVENALAAIGACYLNGITDQEIRDGLASFKGVKRRFEYIIKTDDLVFIDDYAHHPEELKACISSVKKLFPGKLITAVFQPHLYSRTRDFYDGFAESLSMADEVLLLDIYPAREKPIEGVSSATLLSKINLISKMLVGKEELPELLAIKKPEVLLMLGAGDIDALVEPVRNSLLKTILL